jgi:ubiquinone/menaquinone biosynthesis C-methylase UbiE/uncharacterized protein YbaR (Trm112 family)
MTTQFPTNSPPDVRCSDAPLPAIDSLWGDHLICPDCRNRLRPTWQCDSCLRQFTSDEGVPVLMPRDATIQMAVDLKASTDVTAHLERLGRVLQDPPVSPRGDHLPYHLDAAHAHVFQNLPRGSRVLEIGCGGGQARPWVKSLGFEYVGVDVSTVRVFEWLQQYGGPDLLCDAHRLPFASDQFDVVYCAAVFEHLAFPHLAAQEIYRVLKPGGYLLGNCAFLEPWHDCSYFHMSPMGVVQLCSNAKLQLDYLWPGRRYSGFRAMMVMSGTLMHKLRWLGEIMYGVYRAENHVNRWIRQLLRIPTRFSDIEKRSRVAGAIDWIARKPGNDNISSPSLLRGTP